MGFILRIAGFALLGWALADILFYKTMERYAEGAACGVLGGVILAVSFLFDENDNHPPAH